MTASVNNRRRVYRRIGPAIFAALLGVLTLSTAVPASADTTGATAATVTVQGGSLSITVPPDAGNLGTDQHRERRHHQRPAGPGAGERRAQRRRGLGLGRERHLHRVHPARGTDDRRQRGRLHRRDDHEGRHRDLHREQPGRPHRRLAAVTATGITGDNSATWNPTINVAVPGGMAAGVYSATITHSVV